MHVSVRWVPPLLSWVIQCVIIFLGLKAQLRRGCFSVDRASWRFFVFRKLKTWLFTTFHNNFWGFHCSQWLYINKLLLFHSLRNYFLIGYQFLLLFNLLQKISYFVIFLFLNYQTDLQWCAYTLQHVLPDPSFALHIFLQFSEQWSCCQLLTFSFWQLILHFILIEFSSYMIAIRMLFFDFILFLNFQEAFIFMKKIPIVKLYLSLQRYFLLDFHSFCQQYNSFATIHLNFHYCNWNWVLSISFLSFCWKIYHSFMVLFHNFIPLLKFRHHWRNL